MIWWHTSVKIRDKERFLLHRRNIGRLYLSLRYGPDSVRLLTINDQAKDILCVYTIWLDKINTGSPCRKLLAGKPIWFAHNSVMWSVYHARPISSCSLTFDSPVYLVASSFWQRQKFHAPMKPISVTNSVLWDFHWTGYESDCCGTFRRWEFML